MTDASPTSPAHDGHDDPYLWLEDVLGERALAWVRERNAASQAVLEAQLAFASRRDELRAILDSKERIPAIRRRGAHFYNFWQDAEHPRGLWRRTTLEAYTQPEPAWELVLDLDALGAAEGENWVWAGATALAPAYERCLVSLSRGGADATVVREFDLVAKRFVDGGFTLPEAKHDIDWLDVDTLYVGSDFGPGSMTESGYPRTLRRWRRGTPLAEAPTVFEGTVQDVGVGVAVDPSRTHPRTTFNRMLDFYRDETWLLEGGATEPVRIDKPDDASVAFDGDWLFLSLRSPWDLTDVAGRSFPAGALLVTQAAAYLRGERAFELLFEPTPTRSLEGYSATGSRLLLQALDNVASRVEERFFADGRWQSRHVEAPFPGSIGVEALYDDALAHDPLAERYLLSYTDFLTPESLYLGTAGSDERQLLKARPRFFDTEGLRVEQSFATSKDGTRVPYFTVWPRNAQADGRNPTLLYGYGGFEISEAPFDLGSAGYGQAWVGHGGVFVLANIRGGGEFGPGWHQAAIGPHKQRSYDDFIAVAEDLIRRGVTSPAHLGIQGGSNGGLLVGACFVQRPELFGAVVCQVPLLDMRRYHRLLAGASWMAEYGDPDDPEDWAAIAAYAPYQNVKRGVRYPRVFFTTSTRDDRVHPAHARKMVARMLEQGHEVLYYENIEGGHGGAADNAQRAHLMALEFSYLWLQLGKPDGPVLGAGA